MRRFFLSLVLIGLANAANAQVIVTSQGAGTFNGGTVTGATTFTAAVDSSGATHTLPAKVGTVANLPGTCTTGEVYMATDATSGQMMYQCKTNVWTQQLNSGAAGAGTALDNLASVNINTALLAQTGIDAGSSAKPFRNLFFYGTGTYGTNRFKLDGACATGVTCTVTFPDVAASTLVYAGGPGGTPSSITLTNASGTAASLTAGITNGLKSATTTVSVSAATAPSANQVLTATNSTTATWQNLPTSMVLGSISGSTTLTSSDCGGIYLMTGTAADYAVNLPNGPSDGCAFVFKAGSTTTLTKLVTITRQGSDTIEAPTGTTTSFVMWSNEYCGLTYHGGTTEWKKVGCVAIPMKATSTLTSNQAVTTSTVTKVLLDTSTVNVGSMWRSGSNDFIIRRTGNYQINAINTGVVDDTQAFHVLVIKTDVNGTQILRNVVNGSSSTQEINSFIGGLVALTAGDVIILANYHTHGSNVTIPSNTSFAPCILSLVEQLP